MIRRRRETDPRVTSLLEGHERERLLGWGELVDGTVVACTDWAIYLPETGRIPWDAIVRGEWSEEFLDLLVQLRPGQKATHMRLRFEEPGLVPAVVRERVQWTVVASQPMTLRRADGVTGGVTFNARRSAETGEVRWAVVFDSGIDARDPRWRAAADAALAELRDQLGV